MKAFPLVSSFPFATVIAASFVLGSLHQVRASISYTTPASTYSQNFDSLPISPENTSLGNTPLGWTDDNAAPGAGNFSIVGWYLYHPTVPTEGGFNGHQRFRATAGTQNTGSFYSFGTSGSTERALGDIGSTTLNSTNGGDIFIGLRLSNNTGQTLDSFTLGYNGEQWRDGGNATPVAQSMSFEWSTTAAVINDPHTLFTSVASLGYSSPVFTTTAAAVDGNNAGRVVVGPVTVSGINWLPGTDLWLRWDDLQNSGNDHGLGIDDLSFSADVAVPEPATGAVLTLGFLALGFLERKRKS